MNTFKINLEEVRENARQKMHEGAVTPAYAGDKEKIIDVLNSAVATEIVCMLRYKNNYYRVSGIKGDVIAQEFLEHAKEEEQHLDMLSERITQLGGIPDYNPKSILKNSHAEYSSEESVSEMLKNNLEAERVAIQIYSEMVRWIGMTDPTTRNILETILKMEEEHADDLADLLEGSN